MQLSRHNYRVSCPIVVVTNIEVANIVVPNVVVTNVVTPDIAIPIIVAEGRSIDDIQRQTSLCWCSTLQAMQRLYSVMRGIL